MRIVIAKGRDLWYIVSRRTYTFRGGRKMYFNSLVNIPEPKSKITYRRKNGIDYVYYEYTRVYDKTTQLTYPKRVTIGKRSENNPKKMQPNQNFLKYFPDVKLPDEMDRTSRSCSLKIGDYVVIKKILEEYNLDKILSNYFEEKDLGLFFDLAAYTIITENNAGQYYPDYAYNHPLFTPGMYIYSDTKVSDFQHSITADQSVGFLNEWNESRDHRERIYISYDATNKNCQAGDIEIIEYGHPKDDKGLPVFNYAIAYDTSNKEPLFYEKYPGSITDVSQLEFVLDKAYGYGYRHIGFILDRGYFSHKNLLELDNKGYPFVIMIKGLKSLVKSIVFENRGTFEEKRINYIDEYETYGKTIKMKMYETDERERYIHIYHSVQRESAERTQLESKIRRMKKFLNKHINQVKQFGDNFNEYFILHYDDETKKLQFVEERISVIEKESQLCGYFCIISSEKMTAKEALKLYKSRDTSEKLFSGDKSYLGNKSLRVYTDEAADAKIFIEFVALIVRNRIYTCLKEKVKEMGTKPNYMTVPAALAELEKIEMVRLTDNLYHFDHAVTKTQKTILSAFGIDEAMVKRRADEISKTLENNIRKKYLKMT